MRTLALAAVAVMAATVTHAAPLATDMLNTVNRAVNHTTPLANRVLPWDQEGKPGYDCKGFVALKIAALEGLGVADGDMAVLIVDNGTRDTSHAVLLLKAEGVVMDNLNGWLGKPSVT